MSNKPLNKFSLSIILPSFLAISLFTISLYAVFIPMFEESLMQRKKEMLLELTNTAWSALEEQNNAYLSGEITLVEAQNKAINHISKMRYGKDRKDYFWIFDHHPKMLMHPYRKDLNNKDLSSYMDSHQKKPFLDALEIIDSTGQGFLEYYWQWKDDNTKDSPKLSFIKEFKAWNWVLGTGIYLDDVSAEIAILKSRLFKISSFIIALISITLLYLIRQSLAIETKRKKAEKNLRKSRQKYKGLVSASTESTLMFLENKVIFANRKFIEEYSNSNIIGLSFNDIFKTENTSTLKELNSSSGLESQIIMNNLKSDVLISISEVSYSNTQGYIVIVKNLSYQHQLEISSQKLSDEVELSLQLMHQSIEPLIKEPLFCDINSSIQQAASLMNRKNQNVIFIQSDKQILGVVNNSDLKNRAIAHNKSYDSPISTIMTSPVLYIAPDELMYEATLSFKEKKVSHLIAKNDEDITVGVLCYQDCLEVQHNSLSYLVQQITSCETVKQLKEFYTELPLLISALVSSSDNISHITRLITTVSETITTRVIEMTIEKQGEPPCKFAFISTGSVGRSEQVLKTDQDNAIIYEDGYDDAKNYFLDFAEQVNSHLNYIGYNNCTGQIMAKNPRWCQPLNTWKKYFNQWIEQQGIEDILNCKIFFDLKHSYGELKLVDKLKDHFISKSQTSPDFFNQMSHSIVKYKPDSKEDYINLKGIMVPIIGYLRIKALNGGLQETNSMKRLYKLFEQGSIAYETCQEIETSYEFLMHQRIKLHSRQLIQNEPPTNEIHILELSSIELSIIDKIQKQVLNLQRELSAGFKENHS